MRALPAKEYSRITSALLVLGAALIFPLPVARESSLARTPPPLFKPAVPPPPAFPVLVGILTTANRIHWQLTGEPAIVTSLANGLHRPESLHYKWLAADFRTRHLAISQCTQFAQLVQAALGQQFVVILETDPPHLHVARRFAVSAADVSAPSGSQKAMRASAAD